MLGSRLFTIGSLFRVTAFLSLCPISHPIKFYKTELAFQSLVAKRSRNIPLNVTNLSAGPRLYDVFYEGPTEGDKKGIAERGWCPLEVTTTSCNKTPAQIPIKKLIREP